MKFNFTSISKLIFTLSLSLSIVFPAQAASEGKHSADIQKYGTENSLQKVNREIELLGALAIVGLGVVVPELLKKEEVD